VSATLRDVRRGEDPVELYLVDADGRVVILHAHGVHDDERLRTRERALQLLSETVAR
jgi:4-hydroxy-3-methylbut-2-enyl diphosphate reductase IspH